MQLKYGYILRPVLTNNLRCCRLLGMRSSTNSKLFPKQRGLRQRLKNAASALRLKFCIWKLHFILGKEFNEEEFVESIQKAAAAMVEAVRKVDWSQIHKLTTPEGSLKIYSIAQGCRNSVFMELARFKTQHLSLVFPLRVLKWKLEDQSYIYLDICIIGLRILKDFETEKEKLQMESLLEKALLQSKISAKFTRSEQKIVSGSLYLRFRYEITKDSSKKDWLIDDYKMFEFRVFSFSPATKKFRVVQFSNLDNEANTAQS